MKPQEALRPLQEPLGETLGVRRYLGQRKVIASNDINRLVGNVNLRH